MGSKPLRAALRALRRKVRAAGSALETARAVAIPPALGPVAAIAVAELAPLFTTAARAQHALKHGESALLAVVEVLVEGVDGVGDLLERGAGLRQGSCTLMHAVSRIRRLRLSVAAAIVSASVVAARIDRRANAVEAQLRHLARGLLESRPVLLLIGGQSETGMQGRQPGIREGAHVLDVGPAAIKASGPAALLCINKRGADNRESGRSGKSCFPHWVPPEVNF